jgi:large subunit ribosomal protein L6
MKVPELKQTVKIPEGVTVTVVGKIIKAKGPHGEAQRTWNEPRVVIAVAGNAVILISKDASKKQKRVLHTMESQIKNIVEGVKNNNEYKLKICASHFPMQVSMEGTTMIVKNYFGEKIPRKSKPLHDVQIKIQGDKITVTGPDVEKVGEAVSKIEQTCRIANRDRRVFQDGIFLIEKNGKAI